MPACSCFFFNHHDASTQNRVRIYFRGLIKKVVYQHCPNDMAILNIKSEIFRESGEVHHVFLRVFYFRD
jgi:hypothetical protein